jgi:hypothetical protein
MQHALRSQEGAELPTRMSSQSTGASFNSIEHAEKAASILTSVSALHSNTTSMVADTAATLATYVDAASQHSAEVSEHAEASRIHRDLSKHAAEISLKSSQSAAIQPVGTERCSECHNSVARYFVNKEAEVVCANCDRDGFKATNE